MYFSTPRAEVRLLRVPISIDNSEGRRMVYYMKLLPKEEQRFWSKVRKTKTCWIWMGEKDPRYYGRHSIYRLKKSFLAHRISHELTIGKIKDGLVIDHLCRNHSCVNPAHLEAVTSKVNINRGRKAKSEKTHCPMGHPYSGDNLYRTPISGYRECRTCRVEHARIAWLVKSGQQTSPR